MKPLTFCAWCGGRLEDRGAERGAYCGACDRSWYQNPAPTAGAVIVRDGRALITQRGREPRKGLFDIPGGFLQRGEHPLDGVRREVREELGVEIEIAPGRCPSMSPHRYGGQGDWTLALGFVARLVSGEPTPADDVAAIRWISKSDIDEIAWAWSHDRELVREALDGA